MEQQLRSILDEFGGLKQPAESLSLQDDLFAAGLTSFATVGLMLAIEDEFDIAIPDSLLARSTFRSIASLLEVIGSLKADDRVA